MNKVGRKPSKYISKRIVLHFANEAEYIKVMIATPRERTAIILEALEGKEPIDLTRAMVRAYSESK